MNWNVFEGCEGATERAFRRAIRWHWVWTAISLTVNVGAAGFGLWWVLS
jgi:hypothetical protein